MSKEDWIYILSLLVPLVLYAVVLKSVRILALPGGVGPLEFLDQIRSGVFFNLGFALLWIGLFAVARRGVLRIVVLVLFHLSALAVAAVATSAHFYYGATGSILDIDTIVASLSSWRDIQVVVESGTTVLHWLLLSLVLFYVVAGPTLLAALFGSRLHVPTATPGPIGLCSVAAGAAAVAFVSVSLLPTATGSNKALARDPVANMIVTELRKQEYERMESQMASRIAEEDLPTDTRLVSTPRTEKRNVVMIFLESTRASATTPYNVGLGTTPFLTELARKSLFVENAYTVEPHTSKALTGSQCGIMPPLDTQNTEAEPNILPAQCLPDLLKRQGYSTAFFQSATENFERRRMLVQNFGQEDFYPLEALPTEGFEKANYFGYEDDVMLKPSEDWLKQQKQAGKPFMASYLTVTAHDDYVVPQGFEQKDYDVGDDKFNRYLNTVAYQDRFLEKLIQQYKDLGLYDDTIFVVMGDHGEAFGEHDGRQQHDNVPYEEGLRIPMMVLDPKNFPDGGRVKGPANQLDILPTLTGLLGYNVAGGSYPGSPLYALPEGRPVFASCYRERACVASIDDNEKYIYHFGNQDEEFFDLVRDQRERKNIANAQPPGEIKARRDKLLSWYAKVNAIYERQSELAPPGGETTSSTMEN